MKFNLGSFNEPVLLFGGAYGNLQATSALREIADAAMIPAERVICTGDMTAYCAEPRETVEYIREWGIHVIQGNVEAQLAANADDCGCNFLPESSCDLLSAEWYRFTQEKVDVGQREWFGRLPVNLEFEMGGFTCVVGHGGYREMSRFIFASTAWGEKGEELDCAGADVFIGGHSGLPFSEVEDGRLWCNAGVIGMPANDGTNRGWYVILEPIGEGVRCSHRSFSYDHARAAELMGERGLPSEYRDALMSGLWHSCDILPEVEALSQGVRLEECVVDVLRR
ncbi:MAG: metallophosphoesterase family protein [Akkermansiaceae bacterium]